MRCDPFGRGELSDPRRSNRRSKIPPSRRRFDPQARVTIVGIAAGHRVVGDILFAASVRPSALASDGRPYRHVDGSNGFQVADVRRRRRGAEAYGDRKCIAIPTAAPMRSNTHAADWMKKPGKRLSTASL